jgi:tetratricopeptide (TPR) repeat protein
MRALFSGAVAAFALLCCLAANAQQKAEEEARAQFDAGVALFEKGQFAQASVAFARAYELRPSYRILYLVGKCENEQGHFALSLDAYTRYLAEAGDQIDKERQDEVRAEIKRLGALVGTVVIETTTAGATVYVDDVRQGETPLDKPVFVDLGRHVVVVKKGADELHREVVKVAGGQRVVVAVADRGTGQEAAGPGGEPGTEGGDGAAGEEPGRGRGLLIGGIAALAVGVGGGVVGGVFAAKRGDALDEMDASRSGPKAEYDAAKDDARTANAAMIAGFVGAGVFVAAGVVLIVLDARAGKGPAGKEAPLSLRPAAGGIAMEF